VRNPIHNHYQNDNLALSCICRPGVIAIVIVPNCGSFTYRFGVPRFVWFSALNASARTCKFSFSVIRIARTNAMSMVCNGGPYTEFRPTSPNV
jgi:hypothetical protein